MDTEVQTYYETLPKSLKMGDDELNKLPTKRLLAVYAKARAFHSSVLNHYGPRCCEVCREYLGMDWENDVAKFAIPMQDYKEKIKKILNCREHVKRKK